MAPVGHQVRFGLFETDLMSGPLRRDGVVIPLQDLLFRRLTARLERPGEVITRAELTDQLWGTDTFVDAAAGHNTAVAKLRDALGVNAEQPLCVETVPKRGYRFIGQPELRVSSEHARSHVGANERRDTSDEQRVRATRHES